MPALIFSHVNDPIVFVLLSKKSREHNFGKQRVIIKKKEGRKYTLATFVERISAGFIAQGRGF